MSPIPFKTYNVPCDVDETADNLSSMSMLNLNSVVTDRPTTPTKWSCRICYEEETEEHKLISPCLCTGSVQYMHECCLKEWLKAKSSDVQAAECELCKHKFDYETVLISNLKALTCASARRKVVMTLLMTIGFTVLVLIVYSLADFYQTQADSSSEKAQCIVFISLCGITALLIFIVGIIQLKKLLFGYSILTWKIIPYAPSGTLPGLA
jgi:E3 ubiquitin-protein ligase DOA10